MYVGGVIGNLAKSHADSLKAKEGFEGKSEGEIALPKVKLATSAGQKPGLDLS